MVTWGSDTDIGTLMVPVYTYPDRWAEGQAAL